MSDASQPFELSGVYAATLSPMKNDLSPDTDAFVRHGQWLLDNGCDGLAVLGTTGEANSLSIAERIDMLQALSDGGIDGAKLMPGTGCCAISDTVELTRAALSFGAAGVLMLPPFYYKDVSDDGLFAAYSEVIERIGDDRLRIYLYHFPQMSATPISYDLIGRLLDRYPGTIAGMKDSSGDFANMSGAVQAFPGFAVFTGSDEHFLDLLKAGGAGCITAVSNIAGDLAGRVYGAWAAGDDRPEDLQEKLTSVRDAVFAYPLFAALKEIMAQHSGGAAWRNMRPPLCGLGEAEGEDLRARLAQAGHTPPAL